MDYSVVVSSDPTQVAYWYSILATYLWISVVVGLVSWIYFALAYSAIGRKTGDSMPALAWIPAVGPTLIAFRAAKMHWWPWLLIIGMFISILNIICSLGFAVFTIIWVWKMFEKIGRPGWWAILTIIPLLNYIMPGIAAWSDAKAKE